MRTVDRIKISEDVDQHRRRFVGTAAMTIAAAQLGMIGSVDAQPSKPNRKEGSVSMSHHLDTPLAAQNGQLYIDDLYVFSGDGSTVFIMDVNSNITGVHVKPGFHPEARYEFKVHFDGADFEALTYRVSFGEAASDGRQTVRLHALTGSEASKDSAIGDLMLEGRTGEPASAGGTRIWAGRIADSFYIDLSLLAKVNSAVKNATAVDLSAWRPENAKNSFAGTTVESIVLEVSHQHPQLRSGARIGVWCATKLATDAGGWRQINRGGHPTNCCTAEVGRFVPKEDLPCRLCGKVPGATVVGFDQWGRSSRGAPQDLPVPRDIKLRTDIVGSRPSESSSSWYC